MLRRKYTRNQTLQLIQVQGKVKKWIHLTIQKGLSTIQLGTIHKEAGIPNQSREKLNLYILYLITRAFQAKDKTPKKIPKNTCPCKSVVLWEGRKHGMIQK